MTTDPETKWRLAMMKTIKSALRIVKNLGMAAVLITLFIIGAVVDAVVSDNGNHHMDAF